ncbi:hypothetical protein [Halobellus inordinatus]|uniref:hypothetical protein n=1 Tax=Halobellus inordinatus TaxID=1126236 RepID=UPI002115CC99|nr:hypothetical protein [Halobellus ramosii]
MTENNNSDFTLLQRKILHTAASNPDYSPRQLSEIVDCSESYARKISKGFTEEISNIIEFSGYNYTPSFGHPYSIFIPESFATYYQLSEGDILDLEFEIDNETVSVYGQLTYLSEEHLSHNSKEMQARAQGCYFAADELNEGNGAILDGISTIDDGRANLATDDEFRNFLGSIKTHFDNSISDSYFIVGAGILEIVYDKRDPTDLISTPFFNLEQKRFVECIQGEAPELVDVKLYTGEVSTPDDVYFTYYGDELSEVELECAKELLCEYGIFNSNWNYSIPNYNSLVGPTTTEETGPVVKVADNSLNIVPGIQQIIEFYRSDGSIFDGLDGDSIHQAIQNANPQFESLASHSRYTSDSEQLPIRQDGDSIYFIFDQVTLVLSAEGNHIVWSRPKGIDRIDKIVGAINEMIKSQLGLEQFKLRNSVGPEYHRVTEKDWVIDTNTLYHDHVADRPTSILHTIFPHRFFHESNIHISWATVFEMNKHPESGSGSKAANEQGFENLGILNTLETLGFLSVDVQKPPKRVVGNLGNGDVADMYILAYADTCEAHLITGDQSLLDLAKLSDKQAVGVSSLNSLTTPVNSGSSLDREISSKIGADLHTHQEILNELNNKINQEATVPQPESSRQLLDDPEAIIQSWCSEGKIVSYYSTTEDTVCYAQRESVDVVATKSVLEFLPDYVHSADEKYLTEPCLRQISDDITGIGDNQLPKIKLTVPSEYIVNNASSGKEPSEFNIGILDLCDAVNVEYQAKPALQVQDSLSSQILTVIEQNSQSEDPFLSSDDYLALCLAANSDSAHLLLPESKVGLWKFANLLGINVVTMQ